MRGVLDAAFGADFTDVDWEHSVGRPARARAGPRSRRGGTTSASWVGGATIARGRRALARHRLRRGRRTHPRRGGDGYADPGDAPAGGAHRVHYELGALSTAEPDFYAVLGWEVWRGPTAVAGPDGPRRTPEDDGGVMVRRGPRTPPLDLDAVLVCDWRAGDVW